MGEATDRAMVLAAIGTVEGAQEKLGDARTRLRQTRVWREADGCPECDEERHYLAWHAQDLLTTVGAAVDAALRDLRTLGVELEENEEGE